jgi:hypothetical protein
MGYGFVYWINFTVVEKEYLSYGYGVSRHFQQYFSYIVVVSFISGGSRRTRREPPTMAKQLVNFITCGCESSAPFVCNLQSRVRAHKILVIGYLSHWATLALAKWVYEEYVGCKINVQHLYLVFLSSIIIVNSNINN